MNRKLHMLMLASIATMQCYATNETVDTLKTYELHDVTVTSTRAGKHTPMAYSSLDKNQIKKLNHGQDIPFLLALTPSITTTSDAGNGIGYTSLKVRGTDPSRINFTANGIPLNDAELQKMHASAKELKAIIDEAWKNPEFQEASIN